VRVAGYRVYRNGTLIATTSSTSYTDAYLARWTTYRYTVAAYDAAGNRSAQSAALSVTTGH
jgi:chitodextrinase